MLYLPGLAIVLTLGWLALSGYFKWYLLTLGGASVVTTLWLSARLGVIDREGAPYHRSLAILLYLPWLLGEVIKSNVAVIRAILRPRLRLQPALVRFETGCQSDLARTLFANSITLTPGTLTVDAQGRHFLVHALDEPSALPDSFRPMEKRASRVIDGAAKDASGEGSV